MSEFEFEIELAPRDVVVFEPEEVKGLSLGEMGERVIRCKIAVRDTLYGGFAIETQSPEGFEIGFEITDQEACAICKFIFERMTAGEEQ